MVDTIPQGEQHSFTFVIELDSALGLVSKGKMTTIHMFYFYHALWLSVLGWHGMVVVQLGWCVPSGPGSDDLRVEWQGQLPHREIQGVVHWLW